MCQKGNKELAVLSLYLGDYRREYYLREISRTAKLPLKTTQNFLSTLEKNSILKSAVHGKNKYFQLNLNNIQTKLLLIQAEVYRTALFLEKYPFIKTFLKEIKTNLPLIAFGSFACFQAEKNSDFDLLIVAEKEPELSFHLIPPKVHKIILNEKSFLTALR